MSAAYNLREPLVLDGAASLATFVVSASVAALVMSGMLPAAAYFLAHIGCAAFAILVAVKSGHLPRRQAILHAMMATVLGPVGSAGTFLCTVFETCFRPFASPFSEWFDSIFQEDEQDRMAAFVDRLMVSDDPVNAAQRVTSYNDILSRGSIEQKQAIIGLIGRRFSPAFAPALRQALQDPVPSVRVQAASATAAIEGRYSERLAQLADRAAWPGATQDDLRSVANYLVEFAESGIAEAQRCDEAFETALRHFDALLVSNPNDAAVLLSSAKILLRDGKALKAHRRLQRASVSIGISAEIATLQIEALIQLGRFHDLRALAKQWRGRFSSSGREGHRLETALTLWTRSTAVG